VGRSPAARTSASTTLVRLDFYYLENWSLWMDVTILVKTIPARPCRARSLLTTVSVVIVTFDSGAALECCLASLREGEPEAEVIVLDNAGADRAVAERYGVRLLEPGRNLGFAGGCNRGAAEATGHVLVFLNPDTVVDPGALTRLAETLQDPSIGIAMARLRLLDRPKLLNSGGTVLHVSGLAWAGRYGELADELRELEDVASPSGAAMAIRRDLFRELGGFTEELFMYLEDTELVGAAHLHGLRVVVVPGADVYHDYEFGRHPTKLALLDRNREIFVLTAYSLRLLLLLAPVLAATELAIAARLRARPLAPRQARRLVVVPRARSLAGPVTAARRRVCDVFAIGSWLTT